MNDPTGAARRDPGGSHHLERPTGAPQLYAQDGKGYGATVYAHYFLGANDWLVTEFDPREDLAFGWACLNGDLQNAELGYFSIRELEEVSVPLRVRDLATGRELESRIGQRVELEDGWPTEGMTLQAAVDELGIRLGRTRG